MMRFILLKVAVRRLRQCFVLFDLLKAGLQGRADSSDGIAAGVKLFRRVRYAGDLDEGIAQLRRVAQSRAVVAAAAA